MTDPFFRAKKLSNRWLVEGQIRCLLGEKIGNSTAGQKPNGIFVEWFWDGRQLVVDNDYCGIYPLYYFVKPGEIALSTSIEKLLELGASTALDEAALSAFFHLGYFVGEDTPFAEIKALPPIKSFVWGENGLELSRHRPWNRQAIQINHDEAVELYTHLLRQAILRRLPHSENCALPLSGGKDSRHLLFELCAVGAPPKCCITVDTHAAPEEARFAREVTKALGIPHVVLSQNPSQLNDELRKNKMANYCASEHGWWMAMVDYVSGRFDTLYDGIGGDVFTTVLSEERRLYTVRNYRYFSDGNFRKIAEEMIPPSNSHKLFSPQWHKRLDRQLAIDRITQELQLENARAACPGTSFHFASRTRRQIALSPYAMLRKVNTVYSPFLDIDLFNFLASLPLAILLDPEIHLATLHKSYPTYAHIPLSRRGRKKSIVWRYSRNFATELIPYVLRRENRSLQRLPKVLPRLIRCLVDPQYADSVYWIGKLAVYITQLEGECRNHIQLSSA